VTGDSFRGWRFPDGRTSYALALTKVRIDGKPADDVAVEFDHQGKTCPFVDLKGLRVTLTDYGRVAYEDVYGAQGGGARVMRNPEGQLLWAVLAGTLDEHAAEALPELRVSRLLSKSAMTTDTCVDSTGHSMTSFRRRQTRMRASSLSESKVFDEKTQTGSIAIGCVEYLIKTWGQEVISSEGCRDSQQYFDMHIMRRALVGSRTRLFGTAGGVADCTTGELVGVGGESGSALRA
jgi:hypothetical protein